MIQCVHHLRKTTVKALKKTFNSTKPNDVENRPNGMNAKMVPWYSSCNSPDPTKIELGIAMTAKGKHKNWLDKVVHISLGMREELQLPILSEADREITLHQILMSLRSNVCYYMYLTLYYHVDVFNLRARTA